MRKSLAILLACLGVACAESPIIVYSGTAMTEAAPDSAAALRLTLYDRDDTSFTGIMQVSKPVASQGPAYAWHEQDQLRIYTVSGRGADTVIWTSRTMGDEIGGRFEVVGGPRTKEVGTWRAKLVRGRPASRATLALPAGGVPAPPPTAWWPALLVALMLAASGRWIRRLPPISDSTAAIVARKPLGGWLALFVGAQLINLAVQANAMAGTQDEIASAMRIGSVVPGFVSLVLFEQIMTFVLPIATAVGLAMILRRNPLTPRFWFALYTIAACYAVIDFVATSFLAAELQSIIGSGSLTARSELTQLRQLITAGIWAGYWRRSSRVRATFGHASHDPVRTRAARPALAPISGRRVAKVAGAAVAVVAVFFAVGLAMTKGDRYAVPEGGDIRKFVAGRWSWNTEKPRCGERAHIIAFEDGGKIMTITHPPSAKDTGSVTRYDVLFTDSTMIRGAIQGETRLTADGKPVVWDLVLTGPDEYRWHRTDWSSSSWSFTGAISRCKG